MHLGLFGNKKKETPAPAPTMDMPPPPPHEKASGAGLPAFQDPKTSELELPEIPELDAPDLGPTVPRISDTGQAIPPSAPGQKPTAGPAHPPAQPTFEQKPIAPAPEPKKPLFEPKPMAEPKHDEMPGFDTPSKEEPLFPESKPFVPTKEAHDDGDAYEHTPSVMPKHHTAYRAGDAVYLKGDVFRELIESIDAALTHHKSYMQEQDKLSTTAREDADFDKFMSVIEDIQRNLVLTEAALFEE